MKGDLKIMPTDLDLQKELTEKLRKASDIYYNTGDTIMSDKTYDELSDKLATLEKKTGIVLTGSITQTIGANPISELKQIIHSPKMLSLDKTKSIDKIMKWLGGNAGFLSWKMDGLTLVLTYEKGKLVRAATRGNGTYGEDVTHNTPFIKGIPSQIVSTEKVIVRGEAIIRYDDFYRIKNTEKGKNAKNPRNLCSGTIRALDPTILKERPIHFYAFELVSGYDSGSFDKNIKSLAEQGFNTVEGVIVKKDNIKETIESFKKRIGQNNFPSDGLVIQYNNTLYAKSLGATEHHPKGALAFKWQDDTAETHLQRIEWSASATGRLNPIAVFDPVELEGTTVSRALVHNCSIVKELGLKAGDRITVYKADMIIPQVDKNLDKTDKYELPEIICPICKSSAEIRMTEDNKEFAYCPNQNCSAKLIGKIKRFVCRDALNIKGLAENMITKLIDANYITSAEDIFSLHLHPEIKDLDGFGKRSYEKMLTAIQLASSETTLDRVLYGMCIPLIGKTAASNICKLYTDPKQFPLLKESDLKSITDVGDELATSFVEWFKQTDNIDLWNHVLHYVTLRENNIQLNKKIDGKTFVITGSLHNYLNRDELRSEIEHAGGKVAGSVSKNTECLINNDITSESGKNKKAKELGIKILSEADFIKEYMAD